MQECYRIQANSVCRKENAVSGAHYRFSVLTDGLIRLEYSENGSFEDRPTQMAWNRDLGACQFQVLETENDLEIITDRLHLHYDKQPFSRNGLFIEVKGGLFPFGGVWHYGDTKSLFPVGDLKGTARTLDNADGAIDLEDGVISMTGFALLDDSKSLIIREDGFVEQRKEAETDLYFWGYGRDYYACIRDFYRLCGSAPMTPRYAFGNWWSRYHKYTEKTYKELIERFEKEDIPFSVAVIDMDWHLVDIDAKYGSGWTGYTWNKEFFPDPAGFLSWLHEKGLHVTLNVHPADGVRAYEEPYEEMGKALLVDTDKELPIAFDVSDEKFLESYFKYLHHPLEKDGVDFWWIDWQQGGVSKVEGMDPLWMLNHYHFLDSGREGKRPMTFSRYAGPGSHRYPVGFSGDTVVSWESLAFQPYFTASASNIGYGMWSHDIGGHMQGVKDDELSGRWVQYGVFSPIMRLHSTNNSFNSKEPWRYKKEIREVMEQFLRLRHQMVPYLYTMNHRQYEEGIPLVLPMYYPYSGEIAAYQVKNQYLFGSQLMVAAITTPCIKGLNMAKVKAWLPEGEWYDVFTRLRYRGGRSMNLYRSISTIPVFAKTGAIVPLLADYREDINENPKALHIYVYTGEDGSFTLYEDDNTTCAYQKGVCVKTLYQWKEAEGLFQIGAAIGDTALIPEKRDYVVTFVGIKKAQAVLETGAGKEAVSCEVTEGREVISCEAAEGSEAVFCEAGEGSETLSCEAGKGSKMFPCEADKEKGSVSVVLKGIPVNQEITLRLKEREASSNNVEDRCYQLLEQAEMSYDRKERIFKMISSTEDALRLLGELLSLEPDFDLYGALAEIITA